MSLRLSVAENLDAVRLSCTENLSGARLSDSAVFYACRVFWAGLLDSLFSGRYFMCRAGGCPVAGRAGCPDGRAQRTEGRHAVASAGHPQQLLGPAARQGPQRVWPDARQTASRRSRHPGIALSGHSGAGAWWCQGMVVSGHGVVAETKKAPARGRFWRQFSCRMPHAAAVSEACQLRAVFCGAGNQRLAASKRRATSSQLMTL